MTVFMNDPFTDARKISNYKGKSSPLFSSLQLTNCVDLIMQSSKVKVKSLQLDSFEEWI